jgi:hypothetical protein
MNNKPYNSYENKNAKSTTFYNKETTQKERVKCWECGKPHYFNDFPHWKKNKRNIHTVREETIVGEEARSTPKISATLDKRKSNHKASMVEI